MEPATVPVVLLESRVALALLVVWGKLRIISCH